MVKKVGIVLDWDCVCVIDFVIKGLGKFIVEVVCILVDFKVIDCLNFESGCMMIDGVVKDGI